MKKITLGLFFATVLSGCEVPVMIAAQQNQGEMTGMFEITFPAALLIQFDGGTEELLTGNLIGHANGSARYTLTGPEFGLCNGETTRDGVNTMTCENGMSLTQDLGRQKVQMSGVRVTSGSTLNTGFVSAFGWGNDATEAAVRQAIAQYPLSGR